jgi:hypothetical protein
LVFLTFAQDVLIVYDVVFFTFKPPQNVRNLSLFCGRRPGAPVTLAGTYRGTYNMGPLTEHVDPYYVY